MSDQTPSDRDRCRPYGIPFDRSTCPPDDDLTDLQAEVYGKLDSLAATIKQHRSQ